MVSNGRNFGCWLQATLVMDCCLLFAVPFECVKVSGTTTVFSNVPNGRAGQTDQ